MVHLDYRDSRPIYAQIVDGFREQITGGVLRPGEKLPSVRDLAAQLAINPNTICLLYTSQKKIFLFPKRSEFPTATASLQSFKTVQFVKCS